MAVHKLMQFLIIEVYISTISLQSIIVDSINNLGIENVLTKIKNVMYNYDTKIA